MRYPTLMAIAVAAIALSAGDAVAQGVDRGVDQASQAVPLALEIEQRAESAIADARWSEAASMLRQASDIRQPNDRVGLTNLSAAGALYGTIGQLAEARRAFVELSERATQYGEVETAAVAFIDAAHVAQAQGDSRAAVAYYERARRLAMSSYLSSTVARSLTQRLSQSPTIVAGVGG